jgi:hypothetical protein
MDVSKDLRGRKTDQPSRPDLLRVLDAARRLVAVHEQATVALQGVLATPPLGFADGIERDCLAFQLERAARALREAVRAGAAGAVMRGPRRADAED